MGAELTLDKALPESWSLGFYYLIRLPLGDSDARTNQFGCSRTKENQAPEEMLSCLLALEESRRGVRANGRNPLLEVWDGKVTKAQLSIEAK